MPVAARFWAWLRPKWVMGSLGHRAALAALIFFSVWLYAALGLLAFDVVYWLLGKSSRTVANRGLRTGASIAVGVACVALIGLAGAADPYNAAADPKPVAAATSVRLEITSHHDGDVVETNLITLEGTAPANAQITRDITMAADAHVRADAAGRWTMTVSLSEGDNSLTLRIGDDRSTALTIHVTYHKKGTPSGTTTPVASLPRAETPIATMARTPIAPAPSYTPQPSPTTLTFSGPGNEPAPVEYKFKLPSGSFEASWSIRPSGECGATIDVYRVPDDGFAWKIAGVLVDQPLARTERIDGLKAGEYEVWAYVGCPWTVTIKGPVGAATYSVSRTMIRDAKKTWDDALVQPVQTITFESDPTKLANAALAIGHASKVAVAWIDSHGDYDPTYAKAVSLWRQAAVAYDQATQDIFVGVTTGDNATLTKGLREMANAGSFVRQTVEPEFAKVY